MKKLLRIKTALFSFLEILYMYGQMEKPNTYNLYHISQTRYVSIGIIGYGWQ